MRRRTQALMAFTALLACAAALAHGDAGHAFRRPQEPARPLPYPERDVTFESPRSRLDLAGTLVMPRGSGPHPAVVLVAGTGRQDRDATHAGHRPFLVLADHLARRGIAVLRYDERGVGASSGDHDTATTLDFADDAGAAATWLATQPGVDGTRVGVIGHSEGGLVATLAAASPDVAFVVLLGAPGLPMRDIAVRQATLMARADGAAPRHVAVATRMAANIAELFSLELEAEELRAAARPILEEGFAALPTSIRAREIERALDYYTSPWAQFAWRYDPARALRALQQPVLALNGSLDTHVEDTANLAAVRAALLQGGNSSITVHSIPRLNHYFQTALTGGTREYARIEETLSPVALEMISSWILETRPHNIGPGRSRE
jgi:uncharacterized protein